MGETNEVETDGDDTVVGSANLARRLIAGIVS